MSDVIPQGLTDDLTGLARFGRHPDPAIDFCIQVETLESRLHQAMNGLCKPGDEPETVENVLAAIERAMDFRVGGDEGAVKAKAVLRDLEQQARRVPAPAVPDDVAQQVAALRKAYSLVAEWPEKKPDGFMNLLALRNLTPEAAATIEAQAAELARLRGQIADMDKTLTTAMQLASMEMREAALTHPTGDTGA